jgi:Na+/phosphate symporter
MMVFLGQIITFFFNEKSTQQLKSIIIGNGEMSFALEFVLMTKNFKTIEQ